MATQKLDYIQNIKSEGGWHWFKRCSRGQYKVLWCSVMFGTDVRQSSLSVHMNLTWNPMRTKCALRSIHLGRWFESGLKLDYIRNIKSKGSWHWFKCRSRGHCEVLRCSVMFDNPVWAFTWIWLEIRCVPNAHCVQSTSGGGLKADWNWIILLSMIYARLRL